MTRLNKSFITNNTLVSMNEYATVLANAFGGKVTRNDTLDNSGAVFSDDELNKYHKTLYIVRVEFGADRHNALEVTTTSKCFYVAFGDALAENVRDIIGGNADKGVKRIEKWEMKTRADYSLATFAEVITGIKAATSDAPKKATAPKTKARAKKSAKKSA